MNNKDILERLKIEKSTAIDRLVNDLKRYGITYSSTDGNLENVVFTYMCKNHKIAHEIFFRLSGRCVMIEINKKTGKDTMVPMNDMNFYLWLKILILYSFNIEKI